MADLRARILEIVRTPHLAGFATITEDGKPWVRYVVAIGNDQLELRFASFTGARKVAQIEKNPNVHLTCGVTDPTKMAPYLQIEGVARFTTDQAERHAMWQGFLASIFSGPDDPKYGVVVVTPSRIEYCEPGKPEPEIWTPGCPGCCGCG